MNREEIGRLLTKAAMIDNRNVTPVLIAAWHEILHRIDYADAMTALAHHRTNSTAYLEPAHLIAGVRRIRADRAERSMAGTPPLSQADDPLAAPAAKLWLQQRIKAIADGKYVNKVLGLPAGSRRQGSPPEEFQEARSRMSGADYEVRRVALRVACPHCGAHPGKGCTRSGTDEPLTDKPAHDVRIEAAQP